MESFLALSDKYRFVTFCRLYYHIIEAHPSYRPYARRNSGGSKSDVC